MGGLCLSAFLLFVLLGPVVSGAEPPAGPDGAICLLRAGACRHEMTLLGDGTAGPYVAEHRHLFVNSVQICVDGRPLDPESEFRVDYRAGLIWFADSIPPPLPVRISYQFLPYPLKSTYSHRAHHPRGATTGGAPVGMESSLVGASVGRELQGENADPTGRGSRVDSPAPDVGDAEGTLGNRERGLGDHRRGAGAPGSFLVLAGSKSLAVTVGSNREPSLDQSLELSIDGLISEGYSVRAVLADKNVPLETEGTTRELDQLERIFVEIEGPGAQGTFGDYDLVMDRSVFGTVERRLQGAKGEGRFSRGSILLAGAVPRGEFATVRLRGEEGKQGPYELSLGGVQNEFVVLAGTERVWLDGEGLVRGESNDYTIDYAGRTLSFTPRRLITSESRIEVDFQYSGDRYEKNTYAGQAVVASRDASMQLGATYFWEADDVSRSRAETVNRSDRSVLSEAGDDPSQAWTNAAVEVGEGDGDYRFEADRFVYVGPRAGNYQVSFFDVGDGNGDYEYDSMIDGYTHVGEGSGRYVPRRPISLPAERSLIGIDSQVALKDGVTFDVEYALSHADRNRLSPRDDGDNAGDACAAMLKVEDRKAAVGQYELGHFDVDARFHSVGSRFRFPGRSREIDYGYRWNVEEMAEPRGERLGEVMLAYRPLDVLTLDAGVGRLTQSGGLRSRRVAFGAALSPERAPTMSYRFEQVARHDSGEYGGEAASTLRRWRHDYALEYHHGVVSPRLSVAREGRRTSPAGGRDVREWGTGVTFGEGRGFELSLDHTDRREWAPGGSGLGWGLDSHGTIDEMHLAATGPQTIEAHADISRRRRRWIFGGRTRETKVDLADIRLTSRLPSSRARIDARYGIGAEHAALAGERFIEVEQGTGSYGYDALTGLYYPDPHGNFRRVVDPAEGDLTARRVFLAADASYSPSEMLAFESRLSVEELSQESDLLSLYLLRPHALQQDDVTIEGRKVWHHDVSFFAIPDVVSVRFRYRHSDREDNRISGRHREELSTDRSLRVRLAPAPGLWFEGEGMVTDDRRESLEHGLEREEQDRGASLSIRHRPATEVDLTLSLGTGVKEVAEPAFYRHLGTIQITRFTLQPRLVYHPVKSTRLSGGLRLVERTTKSVSTVLPPDLEASDPVGLTSSWDVVAEYRLTGSVLSSLSYSGERRPSSRPAHNLTAEVRAYF